MATPAEWAVGYARQAQADLDAYDLLNRSDLPACQALHFLQMACEKLSKAHLCAGGANPGDLASSHAYVAGTLPVVLRIQMAEDGAPRQVAEAVRWYIERLAEQIEVLAPSVTRSGLRPDNSEYPWEDAQGRLWVPARFEFAAEQLLEAPQWRRVLKMVAAAIRRYGG